MSRAPLAMGIHRVRARSTAAAACILLSGCSWLADMRDEKAGIQLDRLTAPPGYDVTVLARDIPVLRYDDIDNRLDRLPTPATVLDGLPDEERHGARFIAIGPDDKLYVSVGSPCNVCEPKNDEYGVILRVDADGSGREVVARGIRNSVGFDRHPRTRELWFTEERAGRAGPEPAER